MLSLKFHLTLLVLIYSATISAQEGLDMDSETYLFTLADDIQSRESKTALSGLAPKEQVFFLVWSLEAEINNGGFNQFFFNSSGDHATATAEALRAIGATKTAAIVEAAMSIFGAEGPNRSKTRRQQQLTIFSDEQQERLSDLDAIYYTYPDNLSGLLATYMRLPSK